MADLYGDAIGGGLTGNIDANARRLLGDGASGVGPYTNFGTPKLQALKIVSATINFTTTPTVANSNLYKAVSALQGLAEIYYVGIPTASGANQFVALVNYNNTDNGNGYATYGSDDESFENIEDAIRAALGTAEDDVTVTKSVLTGLSFN